MAKRLLTALQRLEGNTRAHLAQLGSLLRRLQRGTAKTSTSCEPIRPGIFRCRAGSESELVALYEVADVRQDMSELTHVDAVYYLKRFVQFFSMPECRLVTYATLVALDSNKYLEELNRRLQMKLIELEMDKANTRLKTAIERMMEIRRRVLEGVSPLEVNALFSVLCKDSPQNEEKLLSLRQAAKGILGLELKPVGDAFIASALLNFCRNA